MFTVSIDNSQYCVDVLTDCEDLIGRGLDIMIKRNLKPRC